MNDVAAQANAALTDGEFAQFQKLILDLAGISMSPAKKMLVAGRLAKRLKALGLASYGQYFLHLTSGRDETERQTMVDLLTTNETFFFREPRHFDFLAQYLRTHRPRGSFWVWSAASSSGEEAYTIAMVLAEVLGQAPWEVIGTDISTQVLAKARRGQYAMDRIDGIPQLLLKKYCLKGIDEHAGTLLINRELRSRVQFLQSNLLEPRKDLGNFDVIFLRNVMIYFDNGTKRKVIANLLPSLNPEGCFIVGHSESLNGLTDALSPVRPTIYRRATTR